MSLAGVANGAGPSTSNGYSQPAQSAPPSASGSTNADQKAKTQKKRPSRAAAAVLPDDDPDGIARRVSPPAPRSCLSKAEQRIVQTWQDRSSRVTSLPRSHHDNRPARGASPTSCTRTRRRSPPPASRSARSRTTRRSPVGTAQGQRRRSRSEPRTRRSSRTRKGTASCARRRTTGASRCRTTSSPSTRASSSSRWTLSATSAAARSQLPRASSR